MSGDDLNLLLRLDYAGDETCDQNKWKRHWLKIHQFFIKITTFRGTQSASPVKKCGQSNFFTFRHLTEEADFVPRKVVIFYEKPMDFSPVSFPFVLVSIKFL